MAPTFASLTAVPGGGAAPGNKRVTHISVAPLAPFVGEDHHFHPLSQMLLLEKNTSLDIFSWQREHLSSKIGENPQVINSQLTQRENSSVSNYWNSAAKWVMRVTDVCLCSINRKAEFTLTQQETSCNRSLQQELLGAAAVPRACPEPAARRGVGAETWPNRQQPYPVELRFTAGETG